MLLFVRLDMTIKINMEILAIVIRLYSRVRKDKFREQIGITVRSPTRVKVYFDVLNLKKVIDRVWGPRSVKV